MSMRSWFRRMGVHRSCRQLEPISVIDQVLGFVSYLVLDGLTFRDGRCRLHGSLPSLELPEIIS